MASTDFPLITNRACYFSLFREIKMGKRKAKKKRVQLQVKTTCIHGGLSDYTEYLIAQCTEFTISCTGTSLSFSMYSLQGDP